MEFDYQKAIEYVGSFNDGYSATKEEQLEAWSYLIKTGTCWKIMWHGRKAKELIKSGIINENGDIKSHNN